MEHGELFPHGSYSPQKIRMFEDTVILGLVIAVLLLNVCTYGFIPFTYVSVLDISFHCMLSVPQFLKFSPILCISFKFL